MPESKVVERVFKGPPYVVVVHAPYPNAEDGYFTTCIGPIETEEEAMRLLHNIGPTALVCPLHYPVPETVVIGMASALVEGVEMTTAVRKSTHTPYSELEAKL